MPIEITRRNDRTWRMWSLQSFLRGIGARYLINTKRAAQQQPQVVGSPELPAPWYGMRGFKAQDRIVDEIHVYDFVPIKGSSQQTTTTSTATTQRKKIYFFAGGAFKFQASPLHFMFCAALAEKVSNASVSLISYPLAPTNTVPTVFPALQKVTQTLLAESRDKNETAIFIGDSAGGNLVLALPLATLAQDPTALAPSVIVAISPGVNFAHDNPKCLEVERNDVLLSNVFVHKAADDWVGNWPKSDARISPLNADLSVFTKRTNVTVHGVIAGFDVLAPDAERFVEKLKATGVDGQWLIWDQQMHDFPLTFAGGLPEGVEGMKWILKLLNDAK